MSSCTSCTQEPWGRYSASGGVFSSVNGTDLALYSFGGDTGSDADGLGGVVRTNWKFTLGNKNNSDITNADCLCWERIGDSPIPIGYRATATQVLSQPDVVYIMGGADRERVATNHIYKYSISQDTWTQVDSEIPTPRWKHAAVAIDDTRILIMGGRQGQTVHADAWIFDTADLSWRQVNTTNGGSSSIPIPPIYRHGMTFDEDRNVVWIHGGLDDSFTRYANQLWQLKLSSETLVDISPNISTINPPPPRMASHVVEHVTELDVLLLWGGNCADDSELHVFDIQDNTWCRIFPAYRPDRRDAMLWTLQYPYLYMAQGDIICYNGQILPIADVHVLDLSDPQQWEMLYEPYNARDPEEKPYCDGGNAGNCQPMPLLSDTSRGTSTCSAELLDRFKESIASSATSSIMPTSFSSSSFAPTPLMTGMGTFVSSPSQAPADPLTDLTRSSTTLSSVSPKEMDTPTFASSSGFSKQVSGVPLLPLLVTFLLVLLRLRTS